MTPVGKWCDTRSNRLRWWSTSGHLMFGKKVFLLDFRPFPCKCLISLQLYCICDVFKINCEEYSHFSMIVTTTTIITAWQPPRGCRWQQLKMSSPGCQHASHVSLQNWLQRFQQHDICCEEICRCGHMPRSMHQTSKLTIKGYQWICHPSNSCHFAAGMKRLTRSHACSASSHSCFSQIYLVFRQTYNY